MEICNSFELVVNIVDGHAVLDKEYFVSKEEQCMFLAVRVSYMMLLFF